MSALVLRATPDETAAGRDVPRPSSGPTTGARGVRGDGRGTAAYLVLAFGLAWLGVPLLAALAYGLTVGLGLGAADPTLARATAALAGAGTPPPFPGVLGAVLLARSLTVGVLVTAVGAFGEECGWTGYLLPRLLPLGRWRAALLYGLA
jgi:hypothetical protein